MNIHRLIPVLDIYWSKYVPMRRDPQPYWFMKLSIQKGGGTSLRESRRNARPTPEEKLTGRAFILSSFRRDIKAVALY